MPHVALPQTTFMLLLTPDVVFQFHTLLGCSGAHSEPHTGPLLHDISS